jgi:4-amino-4-deoxy-L-arabinose transferase-like glycosyltransferase
VRGVRRVDHLAPFAWGPSLFAASGAAALLLVFASRYGYHRDELYFLAAARRLAWGFVDQPPLTPAIARVTEAIAPGSILALRSPSVLWTVCSILLTALCARELGAGRRGQAAAALAIAASPGILAAGHLLSTSTLDVTLWVAVTFLVLRILRTADVRLWLAVGGLLGIGLLNKWTIGFLVFGLLIGILAGHERRVLASWWFVGAVAIAFAMWAPNLAWQASHGWPQLDMFRSIQRGSGGLGETVAWLPLQVVIAGPLASPLWIAGLLRLFRDPNARAFRALGIAYLVLAVPLAVFAGDKPYYVAALYLPLASAGAVPFERWWARHAAVGRIAAPALLGLATLPLIPAVLPILPASTLADVPLQELNYDLGEQIGWPTFTGQIEAAWTSIPEAERATSVILTGNYGEAGALERYGDPELPVVSAHNSYWWWDTPPASTRSVLAVGYAPSSLEPFFGRVELVGTLDNGLGVDTEEQGAAILLASDPIAVLPRLWPALRHYN